MAELKTQKSDIDVNSFIESIENTTKREDSKVLVELIREVTGLEPSIWGGSIIGFGDYTYKRKGGKEEYNWFNLGFAARKTKLTLYFSCDIAKHSDLLEKLGKHKIGKGCLYINKLKDVDIEVVKQLVERGKESRWYIED
ncbi:MAG TPA: DUF1801 domain-containing protein [Saprospiraceae bacterium]|jgi:hypothetical protein|nr:DUF1801 domain-containing protein [Saprospiraceae bacterium]